MRIRRNRTYTLAVPHSRSKLLAVWLMSLKHQSLQTHYRRSTKTQIPPTLSKTVTSWAKAPDQSPANSSPGFLRFHQSNKRKTIMSIADVFLATSMGIAAGVVISGILVIAWFLAVTPRRTKR
jgi:hypothetical protein